MSSDAGARGVGSGDGGSNALPPCSTAGEVGLGDGGSAPRLPVSPLTTAAAVPPVGPAGRRLGGLSLTHAGGGVDAVVARGVDAGEGGGSTEKPIPMSRGVGGVSATRLLIG